MESYILLVIIKELICPHSFVNQSNFPGGSRLSCRKYLLSSNFFILNCRSPLPGRRRRSWTGGGSWGRAPSRGSQRRSSGTFGPRGAAETQDARQNRRKEVLGPEMECFFSAIFPPKKTELRLNNMLLNICSEKIL